MNDPIAKYKNNYIFKKTACQNTEGQKKLAKFKGDPAQAQILANVPWKTQGLKETFWKTRLTN